MGNEDFVPDRNCEVCGIRVQGAGAVASVVGGHCSACGAVLRGYETPEGKATASDDPAFNDLEMQEWRESQKRKAYHEEGLL